MAGPAFWKGYLKLSLVTCPVAMQPATTESQKVRFHTLNRKTGNRVMSQYVDSETLKPVKDGNEAKAYERGEQDFVLLEDQELDAVALESTRTIDIGTFAARDSIEWIWFDKPHYLIPDDPVGEEAFCVIRDAMAASDVVGISRLVMYRRERAVMLEPRDKGIVLWTLRYGDEVRDPEPYFDRIPKPERAPKLSSMVKSLIKERTKEWTHSMVGDPIQDRLLEIIESKRDHKRKPVKKQKTAERPDNVIDIMDALRKSLGEGGRKRKS